ncbi:hypothetical protein LX32DRAFT_698215 [Colletotrichum zoysiae]|uniref:Uncharacterized protein n=1 Tax=Colletotrichum zoysiae TaxID=1216348 RepID=A0AAD9LWA3_9PEZI|nr:hypothetical protein LX32DRAFT_698215 [Colletotrichum zoysiae]
MAGGGHAPGTNQYDSWTWISTRDLSNGVRPFAHFLDAGRTHLSPSSQRHLSLAAFAAVRCSRLETSHSTQHRTQTIQEDSHSFGLKAQGSTTTRIDGRAGLVHFAIHLSVFLAYHLDFAAVADFLVTGPIPTEGHESLSQEQPATTAAGPSFKTIVASSHPHPLPSMCFDSDLR